MAYVNNEDKVAHGRRYYAEHRDRQREVRRAYYAEVRVSNPLSILVRTARARAKQKGVPCTMTVADLHMPEVCPVLGIPLFRGNGLVHDNSPSIDRIIPSLGYIPGNVRVVSYRANRLKCDATLAEMRLILADLETTKGG